MVGGLWFAQALVPWTSGGTLSRSSSIDAAALIRSGAVDALIPAVAGWLLLVLPVVGLLVIATLGLKGRIPSAFRTLALISAVIITASLSHYLAHFQINKFGPGALLAWAGCAACAANLVVAARAGRR